MEPNGVVVPGAPSQGAHPLWVFFENEGEAIDALAAASPEPSAFSPRCAFEATLAESESGAGRHRPVQDDPGRSQGHPPAIYELLPDLGNEFEQAAGRASTPARALTCPDSAACIERLCESPPRAHEVAATAATSSTGLIQSGTTLLPTSVASVITTMGSGGTGTSPGLPPSSRSAGEESGCSCRVVKAGTGNVSRHVLCAVGAMLFLIRRRR